VIAYGSGDPVWLKALRLGQDLHSICADLVFGAKWKTAAEKDCLYYSHKQKCKCPQHVKLRNAVKSINFGLAYGMSAMKLSDKEDIPIPEAEALIRKYFKTFPKIKKFLTMLGNFGTSNGFISTYPPFNRIRWFEDWAPSASYKVLGSIERRSKNTPIQGTSADMTKLALVLIRDHLQKTKSPVLLVMTVHDQIDTECPRDIAATWKRELTVLMETAALRIIRNGLLKAETKATEAWEK
jgi:DNA polymerase-1